MELLGVASCGFHQPGYCLLTDLHQASGGSDTTAFGQVFHYGHRFGLRDFVVEQWVAPPFRKLLLAFPAAQEPDVVLAVLFTHGQVACPGLVVQLAFPVDTR
jgi:hypothetical protein